MGIQGVAARFADDRRYCKYTLKAAGIKTLGFISYNDAAKDGWLK